MSDSHGISRGRLEAASDDEDGTSASSAGRVEYSASRRCNTSSLAKRDIIGRLKVVQRNLCGGLGFQGGSRCNLGRPQGSPCFSGLHFAVTGSMGVAGSHAGSRLGSEAARLTLHLGRCRLCNDTQPFAGLVRCESLIYFLLPRWFGGGLAHQCTQISRIPSDTVLRFVAKPESLFVSAISDQLV